MASVGTSAPFSLAEAERIAAADLLANHPRLFLAVFHHRTTRGEVMDFVERPFLVPIYKDKSDQIVVQKCSQIGMTD